MLIDFISQYLGNIDSFFVDLIGVILILVVLDNFLKFILGSIASIFTFKGR